MSEQGNTMPDEDYMDFDRFIESYELRLEREFDRDDVAASWAPSTKDGPLFWGDELDAFGLNDSDPMSELAEKPSAALAVSPDSRLMAVATNAVVRIYEVESKTLTAEFWGHEEAIETIRFWELDEEKDKEARYVVVAQDAEPFGADGVIIAWYLDKEGQHINNTDDLINFEGRFVEPSSALSCDKTRFVYSDRSISTRDWRRRSDWHPQLAVRSLSDPQTEVCRLKGHQDAIKWASWSPTDPNIIASASWDESFGIWNAATGERIHNIRDTSGAKWTGCFSPDGRQILLAGGARSGGPHIAIYDVSTGNQVTRFEMAGLEMAGLDGWSTPLTWSPSGDAIALVIKHSVVLWQISTNTITEVLRVQSDGSMRDDFCEITTLKWLERQGNRLLARLTDNTILMWDRQRNWKWRLQRSPTTKRMKTLSMAEAFIEEKDILLSLDGDWRIRTWNLKNNNQK